VAVVACPKRTTRIDSVEESAEENNICSWEKWSDRRLETTA
jgi:hypothetical protein